MTTTSSTRWRLLVLVAVCAVMAMPGPALAQVPYERILDAASEPEHWLTYSGTYGAQRYSTLNQIDRDNVDQLQPAWIYQARSLQKFEVSPLVVDGVMYITEAPSDATALDLRTGRPIWSYRRSLPQGIVTCCGQVNRGVARLDDQVFLGTVDAHLVALDARTGRVRWDIEVADYTLGYSVTVAPLALKDKIIVGISGGEYGIRGFLDAYDPLTGERLWRFWTVPGPGEPSHDTWSGDSWERGGAPTWVTGAYDPELDLLYWGTGNPGPDFIGEVREGDNLYSESLLALDPDTGQLKWHFQFLPHDIHDYDSTQVPVLLDAEFEGRPRQLVVFPNRNGFYYVLDPLTGDLVWEIAMRAPPWAGLMSTAGGLVFSGTMEGDFFAADAQSGDVLWRFQTGGAVYANPITYLSEGRQFIAIAAGHSLMTFALPE